MFKGVSEYFQKKQQRAYIEIRRGTVFCGLELKPYTLFIIISLFLSIKRL